MTAPLSPEAANVVAATVPLVGVLGTWVEAADTESGQSFRFAAASDVVRYIEAHVRRAEEFERLTREDAMQRHPSVARDDYVEPDPAPARGIARPFRLIEGGAA